MIRRSGDRERELLMAIGGGALPATLTTDPAAPHPGSLTEGEWRGKSRSVRIVASTGLSIPDDAMTRTFHAFGRPLLEFLEELSTNNDREWFAENKARYESDVLDPCLDFIAAMSEPLQDVAPRFRAIPKRTGGSLMRIYRDTRFARDKRPYKTNVGIQFRHELGKDVHAPGYYFHIDPREVFLGVGTWRPAAPALAAIRGLIADKPDEWLACRDAPAFAEAFALTGESLVRPPRGFDPGHPMIDDLKRKSFLGIHYMEHGDLFAGGVVDRVAEAYRSATPYMRFLCRAIGVPF